MKEEQQIQFIHTVFEGLEKQKNKQDADGITHQIDTERYTSKERLASTQDRLKQLRAKTSGTSQKDQNQERLRRLRERRKDDPDRGPEFER